MTEALCFLAVCLLIAFVVLRAYAARSLIHLKRRAGEVVIEERQARLTREKEETSSEGLAARIDQLRADHTRRREQLQELDDEIEVTEAALLRARGADEEQAARASGQKPIG